MRRFWAIASAALVWAFGCETADRGDFTFEADGTGVSGSAGDAGTDSGGGAGSRGGAAGKATGATASGAAANAGADAAGAAGASGGAEAGGSPSDGDAGASGSGGMQCGAEEKWCDGSCVAINDPTYGCGDTTCDASTCPNPGAGGSLACDDGVCVIDTCPQDYKKCDDKCVSAADPTYGCGETTCDDTLCPEAGNGTVVCQDGACVVGKCGSGSKKCGDKCVTTDANHGCDDAAQCTACASNEACEGSPTTCQCVPTPQATACSGKDCGSVSDACGGTYSCGTCGGTTPACVSGACRQCATVSDCPSGTFNCSNDTCVCRVASSANGLKDGGFDSASVLNGWAPVDSSWTDSDADGCPASGSVTVTGSITKCFSGAVAGAEYALGFVYKQAQDSGSGCYGAYYQDSNCTVGAGTAEFINTGAATASPSWTSSFSTGTAPENTNSIQVVCSGGGGTMMIDQVYLRTPVVTGAGF